MLISNDRGAYLNNKSQRIRNVSIVAHVDHGKSTLADRLIEKCTPKTRDSEIQQRLDNLSVERERGITVKAQTVRLEHKDTGLICNIIDTPGHVDFSYEVGRSLFACEGILLVVDATQGIEAQTMAHVYSALEHNHLRILPVINKIDLPTANVEATTTALQALVGGRKEDMVHVSAKTGQGIDELFLAIERLIPAPSGSASEPLQCLLIDSWYDQYHGVIMLVRVINGSVKMDDEILLMSTNTRHKVNEVGFFLPHRSPSESLNAGDVGYIIPGIRDTKVCNIGDTITHAHRKCKDALHGFEKSLPVVFCGIFPEDSDQLDDLRSALHKLNINDSSFTFEPERSVIGMGFRCGFLGILHLEVIEQRLSEEFGQDILLTVPSVSYQITYTNGKVTMISSPADFPDPCLIKEIQEPWVIGTVFAPHEYVGKVIELCNAKRGILQSQSVSGDRTVMVYELPLAEIIFDFHDELKLRTKGYASFDYKVDTYRPGDLVKLRVLINSEEENSLSSIVHRENAQMHARRTCETLAKEIPRQNIVVKIQVAIGSKIIASESLSAYRKDVTAKCYGGHKERKKKLLEKQKKGKARMQAAGRVHVPNSAYIAVMKPMRNQ